MATRLQHVLLLLLISLSATRCGNAAETDATVSKKRSSRKVAERLQDTVWLVSTRHLGCPSQYDPQHPDFQVVRYDRDDGWQDSDLDALLDAAPPGTKTIVYVHGNRVDWCTAFDQGLLAYRRLMRGSAGTQPIRFVIWSWPSTRIHGPLRDVRAKAARSDCESHYLAWLLMRLEPGTPVGLFGFSYGGRIICGALHLMAGGRILGLRLPSDRPRAKHWARAALLAPAVHNYWLLPESYHGKCLSQIDRLLLQYNSCDPVLRMYHLVDRCSHAQALGYTGIVCRSELGEQAGRIEEQDACCTVGNSHNACVYLTSPALMKSVRACLLDQ